MEACLLKRSLSAYVYNTMHNASPASDFDKFLDIYKTGFGSDYLINDDFRIRYL